MDDFDPNMLDDRESDRRRRRRRARDDFEAEYDDAWAAANEDDIPDHHVQLEDLAAYYVDEDERRRRDEADDLTPQVPDLGPLPTSAQRLAGRQRQPREERIKGRYKRDQAYAESPSYQSARGIVGKMLSGLTGNEPILPPGKAKRNPDYRPGMLSTLPFWAILILVFIGFMVALMGVLACVWVMVLMK